MDSNQRKIYSTYWRKTVRVTVDFSSETRDMTRKSKWHNNFQVLKEINCQYRILYTVKMSFRDKGKTKTFTDERKKNLSPAYLKEWLSEVL